MRCPKCYKEMIPESGNCPCGFNFKSSFVWTVAPMTSLMASEVTNFFQANDVPKLPGWGPERPTYTMNSPAKYAVFNSITDNAAVGDERDFVRIVEKNTGGTYSSDIILEAGKEYEVFIYFHNDASSTFNDKEHNYVGVARDVRISSMFPTHLEADERGAIFGRISASNTVPKAIWDTAYITAQESLTLHYVSGSAKIYNRWRANGQVLSMNLFSEKGTFIGLNELNGVVPGCDIYSGQVVYTIHTIAAKPE